MSAWAPGAWQPGAWRGTAWEVVAPILAPDVLGLRRLIAIAIIEGIGLSVIVIEAHSSAVPEGEVSAQFPPGGAEITPGSTITITVSSGEDSLNPELIARRPNVRVNFGKRKKDEPDEPATAPVESELDFEPAAVVDATNGLDLSVLPMVATEVVAAAEKLVVAAVVEDAPQPVPPTKLTEEVATPAAPESLNLELFARLENLMRDLAAERTKSNTEAIKQASKERALMRGAIDNLNDTVTGLREDNAGLLAELKGLRAENAKLASDLRERDLKETNRRIAADIERKLLDN